MATELKDDGNKIKEDGIKNYASNNKLLWENNSDEERDGVDQNNNDGYLQREYSFDHMQSLRVDPKYKNSYIYEEEDYNVQLQDKKIARSKTAEENLIKAESPYRVRDNRLESNGAKWIGNENQSNKRKQKYFEEDLDFMQGPIDTKTIGTL